MTHLLGPLIKRTTTLNALRRLGEGGIIGGTLLPPNIAAVAAQVLKFGDKDAGLETGVTVAAQAYRLRQTLAGNVPCLPLTFRR